MRILIIHPRVLVGGAENVVIHLAYELKNMGHDAKVITLYVDLTNMPQVAKEVEYITPPEFFSGLCKKSKIACVFLALPLLFYLIKKHSKEADILNPHNGPAYWLSAFFHGKKFIAWNCNEPPIPVSWKFSKQNVYDFLASKVSDTPLEKLIGTKKTDIIIVLDKKNRDKVVKRYGINPVVLNTGIDFEFYRSDKPKSDINKSFDLLTVGKLTGLKNQIVCIRALKPICEKIPQAKLTVVGSGPCLDMLKDETKKLGLETRVNFLGTVDDERLKALYEASHAVLFPALNQSWGLTPFEALTSRTISIVSDDCGASEVIGEQNIGVVAQPQAEEFAKGVINIFNNWPHYQEMARRGYDYVRDKMTWRSYAENWLNAALNKKLVKNKLKYDDFNQRIFELVEGGKNVLDIGCATGKLAESLINQKGCSVFGVEFDKDMAKQAKARCRELICQDIEEARDLPFPKYSFDVIVLADVLEHLRKPDEVLIKMKSYLKEGGYLLISIPNISFISTRLNLLLGRFDYTEYGVMDKTHLRFFTLKTARRLIEASGYKIIRLEGYNQVKARYFFLRPLGKMWKSLFATDFIVKAVVSQ